jgi:fatty acid desaturase
VPEGTRLYTQLKTQARAAGVFRRSYVYYGVMSVFAFGGYAAAAAGILAFDGLAPLFIACLAFSFFTVQLAGIMHDCGHRAVFASTRNNDILGFVAGGAIGMILSSWRYRHNQHHAFPNQQGKDPDFQVPLTAFDMAQFLQKGRLGRSLARFQAFYFYVILSTASLSNRLGGITYFLRSSTRSNRIELLAYIPAVVILMVGPFLLFPLDKAVFVFVTVHLTSGLYLANCFAPNHKGMTTLPSESGMSFFEQQVVTARNIRGGWLADVLMVGLNHQVEHHLFPNTPRNKLHLLRASVSEACEREGIAFEETGFARGGYAILQSLHEVSRQV